MAIGSQAFYYEVSHTFKLSSIISVGYPHVTEPHNSHILTAGIQK
ncbi:hypothetical protein [Bacillus pinisoli]|nr:hypothetical protein [Bacillus pinisoli]